MSTFLKYLFYVILIIVVYLVARGIYNGDINKDTTVGSVVDQVGSGSAEIVRDSANAVGNAVQNNTVPPAATSVQH